MKVSRWASRIRVRNTSSYTAGPPPRSRKIHPFFRRSIPGPTLPTLPPPFFTAPVRFTPVAVLTSSHPRVASEISRSHPRLRRKVSLLRRFLPRWRHTRCQEPPFRLPPTSSSSPAHRTHTPLSSFSSDGFPPVYLPLVILIYSFRTYPNLNVCTVDCVYTCKWMKVHGIRVLVNTVN